MYQAIKTCSACGVSKPFEEFHTWIRAKDGYRRQCKNCTNEANSKRYHATKRLYKNCTLCGAEMPLAKARLCPNCRERRIDEVRQLSSARQIKNYEDKPCLVCETLFQPFHENDKYCSYSCKDKNRGPRKYRSWHPDKKRNYQLQRTYGISQGEYEELLAGQGGGCAICAKTPLEEGRSLAVDHDHTSGEIFGILCSACNRARVGHIRDPDLFSKAADYLSKGTGIFVPDNMIKPKKRRKRRAKNPSD